MIYRKHSIELILKLKKYGISDDLLELIQNYLHMPNQRVFVCGTFSSLKSILAGLPQGSVLSYLLFLIYINDIADYLLHGKSRPRWLSWMRVRLVIRKLRVRPPPGRHILSWRFDHEIFSTVILCLPLIQKRAVVSF